MNIKGRLVFKSEEAAEIARLMADSLTPDNIPSIETYCTDKSVTITFSADKIGTILSSVDDYLMNAIVVQKLSYTVKLPTSD
ncbi:MAG: hypothetical protein FIB08_16285 [Candidatus Methanoperedens sp.]|nr:hypothetical protein [Candidatus Methanoperedens sp.]